MTYRVINYGLKPPYVTATLYPGDENIFSVNNIIDRDGVLDNEIVATPGACVNCFYPDTNPGDGGSLFAIYLPTPGMPTAQMSFVTFGITLNATITTDVGTPSAVAGALMVSLDGAAGQTSSASVKNVATFTPPLSNRFNVVQTSSQAGITINPNGTVTVAPGTPPGGPYTVNYRFDYLFNAAAVNNVGSGSVNVTVTNGVAGPIAVPDNFTLNRIDGEVGGTIPISVLVNDDPNGGSPLIATLVNNGGVSGLTLSSTGLLTVPAGTAPGTYVATYSVMNNLGSDGPVTITFYTYLQIHNDGTFAPNGLGILSYNLVLTGGDEDLVAVRQVPRTIQSFIDKMLENYTGPKTAEITAYLQSIATHAIRSGKRIYDKRNVRSSRNAGNVDHTIAADFQ